MKKIILSILIPFFCVSHLQGRWIALKNDADSPINIKLSTSEKMSRRKPKHMSVMIEPGATETIAVFSKKRGSKGNYLTEFKISWVDRRENPRKTKGIDLERINRYIASLTDNASKDDPQSHAISIAYDAERQRGPSGSWVKNPQYDFFDIKIPSDYDPFKAERVKKGAKEAGAWIKEKIFRMPPSKQRH